jgi:uncharacterized cupredoxin-like copper-binding protein
MRQLPASERRWLDLLGFGVVSSIGLGFFTGGLQHFPDSPGRSAWVVPLGFAMSLVAFWILQRRDNTDLQTQALGASEHRSLAVYGAVAGILVTLACITAWQWFEREGGSAGHDHASHSHDHAPASAPTSSLQDQTPPQSAGSNATAQAVRIEMFDTMRFSPEQISIRAGEPVKFTVVNRGAVRHELVIGTPSELAEHAREMKTSKAHHHHHDNAVSVEPGQSITVTRVFPEAGELGMACFEPGHHEAGMRGSIRIEPKS